MDCNVRRQLMWVPWVAVLAGVGFLTNSFGQTTPNYPSMKLAVPYLCQYGPPGDKDHTKNCGQACSAMLAGYYYNFTPSSSAITNENAWLAKVLKDSRYKDPNGYYTNFENRNALGKLLTDYWGLKYSAQSGRDVATILNELKRGRPVIVCVTISSGTIGTTGDPHWACAIGWNKNSAKIIVNDPGSKFGSSKEIPVATFDKSWALQKRLMAPVYR